MSAISSIPADPALEVDLVIHECQAGYASGGAKFAVVSCGPPTAHGNFEIQEADTHLTRSAENLEYVGVQWGRHCWRADFSNFREIGKWRLWAHTGSGHEAAVEITIRFKLNEELAEKAAKHFHRKRCGVLCHTHDGVIRSTRQKDFGKPLQQVNVTGGWHDAHDDNKWIFMAWSGVDALCETWETMRPNWSGGASPISATQGTVGILPASETMRAGSPRSFRLKSDLHLSEMRPITAESGPGMPSGADSVKSGAATPPAKKPG